VCAVCSPDRSYSICTPTAPSPSNLLPSPLPPPLVPAWPLTCLRLSLILLLSGSFAFAGFLDSVTRQIHLDDDAVMHQPVHRCRGRHRVLENLLPFRERQIAGHQHAAAFVTFRQQRE